MILSKTCDHAIRATLYVALHQERNYVPIREISEHLGLSFHFLTKILQVLTQQKIMNSFKGPNGGVSLARLAQTISIKEIVVAIDGERLFAGCMLGLDTCSDDHPCPLHQKWAVVRDQLEAVFAQTTLAYLADRIRREGLRLANLDASSLVS